MTTPAVPEPGTIRAPWTPEQVQALNAFQAGGGMHPFTCGNDHQEPAVILNATRTGWYCPDPACDYRQDWAHAFMVDPSAWPSRRGVNILESPGPGPGPGPAPGLRDTIATAMRAHHLSPNRDEADADGNAPCVCGDWREPGPMGSDEEDWDTHLADAVLATLQPELDDLATLRRIARGYCPACGRGDAAPTLDDWHAMRTRAEQAETARETAAQSAAILLAGVVRVQQMLTTWEDQLPDTIRTATAVEAIRTALATPHPAEGSTR